jgi:hypothetical protein
VFYPITGERNSAQVNFAEGRIKSAHRQLLFHNRHGSCPRVFAYDLHRRGDQLVGACSRQFGTGAP